MGKVIKTISISKELDLLIHERKIHEPTFNLSNNCENILMAMLKDQTIKTKEEEELITEIEEFKGYLVKSKKDTEGIIAKLGILNSELDNKTKEREERERQEDMVSESIGDGIKASGVLRELGK